MKKFDLSLQIETIEQIKRRAEQEKRTVSATARIALEKEFNVNCKHKWLYESTADGMDLYVCDKCGFKKREAAL